jgi:hypothetical protein
MADHTHTWRMAGQPTDEYCDGCGQYKSDERIAQPEAEIAILLDNARSMREDREHHIERLRATEGERDEARRVLQLILSTAREGEGDGVATWWLIATISAALGQTPAPKEG